MMNNHHTLEVGDRINVYGFIFELASFRANTEGVASIGFTHIKENDNAEDPHPVSEG